jgi:hypothetical protein
VPLGTGGSQKKKRRDEVPRKAGVPNRNYPPKTLAGALKVPRAIADKASGMTTSRLTLAELLGTTPNSSVFKDLVASSRFYGLTTGGINSDQFDITELGERAVGEDDDERSNALKEAVTKVPPFRTFFQTFANRKFPATGPFRDFLTQNANVPAEHVEACMAHITEDAETAGLVRTIRGAQYVDMEGTPVEREPEDGETEAEETLEPKGDTLEEALAGVDGHGDRNGVVRHPEPEEPSPPQAIFVGGRKTKSLEQLVSILDEYKIPHKVTELGANRGRPISQKVADTMKECGAAILIFTPDEELRDLEGNTVWRSTDNVVHELGAAGVLYGNRIVIFREERVSMASNYSDIGHIVFKENELDAKAVELFRELIAFGLVTVKVGA